MTGVQTCALPIWIDEVLGAAAENGHPHNGLVQMRVDLRPAIAEGLVGNGRQRLETLLAQKHHGQMPLDAGAFGDTRLAGKGLLRKARKLQQVVDVPGDQLLGL